MKEMDPVRDLHSSQNHSTDTHLNVLRLEVTCLGEDQLKTSLSSRVNLQDDALRMVAEQRADLGKITHHARRMLAMLNQANRNGRLSAALLGNLKETGQFLRDELFSQTLKERLDTSRAGYMTILLDERLVHIPWELLHDGRQFLCQRYALGRLVQTRLDVPGRQQAAQQGPVRFMILADLDGSLPAARQEGSEIRDSIEGSGSDMRVMMRCANVDVDYVRHKIRGCDWLHFAGHVDLDPAAENHGWRLSQGRFSAGDVAKMAGSGNMPKLLFVNGCQSARTRAWSVDPARQQAGFGMVNAFLLSGVRHYVGASWEIPDEPGKFFALAFYRHLMAGATIGLAVAEARRELIENHGEEQIVWASYVLYGDPTRQYIKARDASSPCGQTTGSVAMPGMAETRAGGDASSERSQSSRKGRRYAMLICLLVGLSLVLAITISSLLTEKHNLKLEKAMAAFNAGDLDAVLDICPSPQSDTTAAEGCLLLRGNALLVQGRLDEAADVYDFVSDAGDATPMEAVEAWMGLGRIASIRGDQTRALDCYQRAANTAPGNPQPLLALAVINEKAGRNTESMAALDAAKKIAPVGDIVIDAMLRSVTEKVSLTGDEARMARIDRMIDELSISARDAATPEPVGDEGKTPLTLWIMEMQASGYSLREGVPQTMTVMIENCLQENTSIRLVDRHLMDKTLAELKLGSSKLAEQETRLRLGRLQAVRMMVSGRMIFAGAETQVSLRCIDTQTSQVKAVVVMTFKNQLPLSEMAGMVAERLVEKIRDT